MTIETAEKLPVKETEEKDSAPKPKKRKKSAIRATLRIINRNFWSFFWFETIYKLLTFALITPLIRKILSMILYFNGITSVTDENIFKMFLHPMTWIGAILIILLAGMAISIEFAGLYNGIKASDDGHKITMREMFANGFAHCFQEFRFKNWMYLLFVILILPLASLTQTATLTGSFSIPDFIIEGINEKWYLQLIYYAGMAGLTYLVLRWLYAIPIMNLQNKTFREASKDSSRYMKKRYLKVLWSLAVCYAALFIVFGILALAGGAAAFAIVHWLDPSMDLINAVEPIVVVDVVLTYTAFVVMASPFVFSRVYVGYERQMEVCGETAPAYRRPDVWFVRNKYFKIGLIACIAIGIYAFLPGRYQEAKLLFNNVANQTMVMAHRGDSVDAPENTLPAFQAAIDHGADAAEMDVQMTKDGTIVVLHDASIDRTSTGHGNIWDVTYDEIKDLDNGSFFSPEFTDTRIPTLDQVVKLCKGKLFLNIEIKRTGHDEGIEQKVLDIIKNNEFQSQCDITSMDYNTLVTVRSLDPTIETVYTTAVALGDVTNLTAADAFSVETTFVNQTFVRSLRQNGKKLFVWTVNDENAMQKMVLLGANAIITNDPATCRSVVESNENAGVFGVLEKLRRSILG